VAPGIPMTSSRSGAPPATTGRFESTPGSASPGCPNTERDVLSQRTRPTVSACLTWVTLLVLACAQAPDDTGNEGDEAVADRQTPEPILLLRKASREMEAYLRLNERYAAAWHDLDFTFSLPGSYRRDDPDARAKPSDGTSWRPRGCKLTYVIKEATATTFRIEGVNDGGEVEYEIEQGMRTREELARLLPRKTRATQGDAVDGYDRRRGAYHQQSAGPVRGATRPRVLR